MKYLIQPCCAQRNLRALRDAIGRNGKAEMEACGDVSLQELLPALLTRYADTEMVLVAPSVPDQAAEAVRMRMLQTRARGDGPGNVDCIRRLTIVTDTAKKKSPLVNSWMKDNPFGERLVIVSRRQEDTAILLPDLAVTGPVNMRYGNPFTATVTTKPDEVGELWRKYMEEGGSAEEPAATGEGTKDTGEAPEDEGTPVMPAGDAPAEGQPSEMKEAIDVEKASDE